MPANEYGRGWCQKIKYLVYSNGCIDVKVKYQVFILSVQKQFRAYLLVSSLGTISGMSYQRAHCNLSFQAVEFY